MSPLGRPADDGTVQPSGRHYRGGQGSAPLGQLTVWRCPSCGMQNEGQPLEHGCLHCGAGDQRQGKAGTEQPPVPEPARGADTSGVAAVPAGRTVPGAGTPPPVPAGAPLKLYRLIEYVIRDPQQVGTILRNSLVGTLDMGWGTLTGTIVDSVDPQQEDRLRMARMQPGVWLANESAMRAADTRWSAQYRPGILAAPPIADYFEQARQERERREAVSMVQHNAEQFTSEQRNLATILIQEGGLRFAHTLALALSSIAEELAANAEPEKFLSQDECLGLARAIMAQIPDDWTPTEETPHAD